MQIICTENLSYKLNESYWTVQICINAKQFSLITVTVIITQHHKHIVRCTEW